VNELFLSETREMCRQLSYHQKYHNLINLDIEIGWLRER